MIDKIQIISKILVTESKLIDITMIIPIKYELIHFIINMFNQNQNQDQNQQPNTFQQVPQNDPFRQQSGYQNPMNMYQNMGQGPNNPGMPGNGLFSPGTFRGVMQNQQFQDNPNIETYPNKLADDGYQESGLSLGQGARQKFISKVYMLLSLQLLFTTLLGYFAYNSQWFRLTFINIATVIVVSVALLALSIVMGCCTDLFRRYALPFFVGFTFLMAMLVAISICGFKSKIILTAAAITLGLTIALTIYAWNTSSDLTGCGVYLMILGFIMLIFGIVAIFWRDPIVQLVYSCLSAFLFAIYLVFDTQLVLGRGQYSYTLDDAYLAAIQLFLDIVELFLNILRILSFFDR